MKAKLQFLFMLTIHLRKPCAFPQSFLLLLLAGLFFHPRAFAQGITLSGEKSITLSEALSATLESHPQLKLEEEQVKISSALKRQAAGQFDTLMSSGFTQQRTSTPLTLLQQSSLVHLQDNLTTRQAYYNFNTTKLFRNGVSANFGLDMSRITDNSMNLFGSNIAQPQVRIGVPLTKARGREVVAAQETAAGAEVTATGLDLHQLAAQLLANTAASYWNLVAAKNNLVVAAGSEERGRKLLENVKALIAADHVPRRDIDEVEANLADRVANRIAGEQLVSDAQQQLALDMGLAGNELLTLFDPANDFPSPESPTATFANLLLRPEFVDEAIQNRADLMAAKERERGSQVLMHAAKKSTAPLLLLNFGAGYSRLHEGGGPGEFFLSPFGLASTPNVQAGFTYTFPPANHLASGQFLQAQSQLRQNELRSRDLVRNISATVVVALKHVNNAVLRLKSIDESVEAFRGALDGEREKFGLGQASLTEVLTIEDRLTTALSNQVQAKLSYSLALIQLRLATGTLLSPDASIGKVDADVFSHLPPANFELNTSGKHEPRP